ncbi:glycosyltransferase [Microbacterium sp. NC79]|uniref:glycosyltransferase n=1 Tax=Microbacterium sp. NC79 TaxID=2851009 RepID=UPI001C2CA061|nr:glycosyltransferase [Microbacterium sp. NC79]MBV0894073.1 glycosyltransferase [Microbacterium sp. NC79]
MLYIGARAEGWRVEGSKNFDALEQALPGLGDGDIFHIHWTSPILNPAWAHHQARLSLQRFERLLTQFRDAGVRILWTVHNTLAHNTPHTTLEIELAKLLAARADRIIQLNASTRQAVSEYYDLPPDKLVTLAHASYAGIYAEPPSQDVARAILGIPESASVVGFVGQIRGYKGVPVLLKAVEEAALRVDELVLVLAGKTPPEDIPVIEQMLPKGVQTVRHHAFVSDSDIATWFAACDVMVFPYERVLNSGSVLLSATFGRPCILPAEAHLVAEYGAQPWVSFYETGTDQVMALATAINRALSQSTQVRDSARKFAARYSTLHMTWAYVSLIEDLASTSTNSRKAL